VRVAQSAFGVTVLTVPVTSSVQAPALERNECPSAFRARLVPEIVRVAVADPVDVATPWNTTTVTRRPALVSVEPSFVHVQCPPVTAVQTAVPADDVTTTSTRNRSPTAAGLTVRLVVVVWRRLPTAVQVTAYSEAIRLTRTGVAVATLGVTNR
jgi:hypothetical protein